MALHFADFGNGGVTGIGYVFKDEDGNDIGARVTAGITEIEAGIYAANAATPNNSWAIFWDDSASTGGYAIGDIDSRVHEATGVVIPKLDNIETDTQDLQTQIGTDGAGLTNVPWNSSWDSEVQSEVTDALNAYDGPTRSEATSDKNEILGSIGTGYATPSDATLAKQNEIISLLGNPSGVDIATELWNATGQINVTNTRITAARAGYLDNLNVGGDVASSAEIAGLNDLSAAQVNAEVDSALADYDGPTRAEATSDKDEILGSIGTGYATPSDATLANQTEILNRLGVPSGDSTSFDLHTLTGRLTSDRAGYLDNLNVGGILNDLSALEVGQIATGAIVDYDPSTRTEAETDKAEIGALISGLNDLSSDDVDELLTGYGLDHLISTSVSASEIANDSVIALLASKDTPADFSSYLNTSNSLEAIADIVGGLGGGSGAYIITVTVTDGSSPVPNAIVRVTEGATTAVVTTDSNGNAELSLDAATYNVSITKSGYWFQPEERTVTGTESGTLVDDLEMTQTVIIPDPPTDTGLCAVFGYFEEGQGRDVPCLPISFDLVVPDSGSAKSDRILGQYTINVNTDASGRLVNDSGENYVYLQRNDLITPTGTRWRVTSPDARFTGDLLNLTSGTYDLSHIIV